MIIDGDTSSDATSSDSTSSDAASSDSTSSDVSTNGDSSTNVCSSDDASSDSSTNVCSSDDGTSTSSDDGSSGDGASSAAAIGGWSDAVAGGWNSGERAVGTIRRIPLAGLHQVNQDPAANSATTESATGKAILCVPSSFDATQAVEVLFHLHGHNVGYRQRVASNLPDAGTVRDVLLDQIETQIAQANRPIVAILPQGTVGSSFGNGTSAFDCNACIAEVLAAATSAGVWSSAPSVSRVLLSAHSGGGGSIAVMESQSGQPHLPSPIAALFLFEAINGTNELAAESAYVTGKLNADLQAIGAAGTPADQLTYLQSSFRFRGIYNTQDDFYSGFYSTIAQTISAWFTRNAAALGGAGSDAYNALRANYQVVQPNPYVAHDGIVGQGNLGQALAMFT
jgi:hypothetical protein